MAASWMAASWMATSWLAASWMAATDFGQVIKIVVRPKTPLGETGCLINWMPLHPGLSDLLESPPVLSSTPTTFGCLLFLFRHPVF